MNDTLARGKQGSGKEKFHDVRAIGTRRNPSGLAEK